MGNGARQDDSARGTATMAAPPCVSTDAVARRAVARDWGGQVGVVPAFVARPRTEAEAQEAVNWALEHDLPWVPRGQGHSCGGRAQSEGVVVDLSGLDAVHDVGPDFVTVGAGMTWSQVLDVAAEHGLAPPVITDHPHLSVGGTLSLGGVGGTSYRHGAQADSVVRMLVLTPGGRVVRCGPRLRSDLFTSVLGGSGTAGLILRATLRLVPAPAVVRRVRLTVGGPRALVEAQRELLGDEKPDHMQGLVQVVDGGWRHRLDLAEFVDEAAGPSWVSGGRPLPAGLASRVEVAERSRHSHREFVHRGAADEARLRETGDWDAPHPWAAVFLPDAHAEDAVADILDGLTPRLLGEAGLVLVYPLRSIMLRAGRPALPQGAVVWLCALLRSAPQGDPAAVSDMEADNERVHRITAGVGGTRYRIGAH
ncbi:FAD-binding protein [Actinoalloteichus caeruleus]|uniref:FAD-binding protein n=1 Tax=Actinoalloteichus cyanogriseus TaxID=2893586 RepID=UPI00068A69C5|nr:FAD-binding protein [Actinoalloteichus caeruleus]